MKRSGGIEVVKFSIEKVWKLFLKMCGNPGSGTSEYAELTRKVFTTLKKFIVFYGKKCI